MIKTLSLKVEYSVDFEVDVAFLSTANPTGKNEVYVRVKDLVHVLDGGSIKVPSFKQALQDLLINRDSNT